MTVNRWEDVKGLLHQAMQLAPGERARFLDQACSSDAALRAEVESLLLADEGVRSSFLQSPPLGADSDQTEAVAGLQSGRFSPSVFNSSASWVKEAWVRSGLPNRLRR